MSVITDTAADVLLDANLDQLRLEISNAHPGSLCSGVTIRRGVDAAGDPDINRDQVVTEYDGTPITVPQLNAVIAVHPTITPGATGSFVIAAGVPALLNELILEIGDHVLLDVHIHAALGTLATSWPAWIDWYLLAWRQADGTVQIEGAGQPTVGRIPGAKVAATVSGTKVQIWITASKPGTLHIFTNSMTAESKGSLA